MVQINLYIFDLSYFDGAIEVFKQYFEKIVFP